MSLKIPLKIIDVIKKHAHKVLATFAFWVWKYTHLVTVMVGSAIL